MESVTAMQESELMLKLGHIFSKWRILLDQGQWDLASKQNDADFKVSGRAWTFPASNWDRLWPAGQPKWDFCMAAQNSSLKLVSSGRLVFWQNEISCKRGLLQPREGFPQETESNVFFTQSILIQMCVLVTFAHICGCGVGNFWIFNTIPCSFASRLLS